MPSDSNGLYSLPAGYLATTGLTILASQHNPPLEDIAAGLTARLMRSGVAPMTGPLWLADGVEGTPGLSFNSAKTTGLYKTAGGNIGLSIGATRVAEFGTAGLIFGGQTPIGGTMPYDGIRAPSGWLFKNGQAVSRSTYASLLAALSESVTITTSSGSPTLSSVGTDLTPFGLVGATIEGSGIPSSTTITAITSTTITMSANATGAGTVTAKIFPHGNGDGSTTFNIPDDRGRVPVGRDNMGGVSADRLTKAQTQGIDGDKFGSTGGEEGHAQTATEMPAHIHNINDPGHLHLISNFGAVLNGGGTINTAGGTQSMSTAVNTQTNTTGITIQTAGGGAAHNNVQPSRVTNMIIFAGV